MGSGAEPVTYRACLEQTAGESAANRPHYYSAIRVDWKATDDALPMVRKACAGEMRWRPGGRPGSGSVHSTTLATLAEQNRCQVGTILFDRPRQSHHSFPSWARRCVWVPSAEPAMGAGGAFKFRPLDFGPLDKDDAVPRVRKAEGGKCEGGPVGTTYRRS